jgi:hypothetical protein
VPVTFPALTGSSFTISFPAVRPVTTVDRRYGEEVATPLSIAEIDLDAIRAGPDATTIDTGCRTDLVTIDGRPQGVHIEGDAGSLRTGGGLSIAACGPPLHLEAGEHELRTVAGRVSGFDLDRIVLHLAATGDAANAPVGTAANGSTDGSSLPVVTVTSRSHTSATVSLTGGTSPFWLVHGDSFERGWQASIGGRSLGLPTMIDGGSNGWQIDPAGWPHTAGSPLVVQIEWAPQSTIDVALVLSALAGALCLALVLWPTRARVRQASASHALGHRQPIASCWHLPASPGVVASRATIVLSAAVGLIAALVVDPLSGLVLAVIVAFASRRRLARRALAVLPAAIVGLVGLFYAARQVRSRPVAGFGWVTAFEPAHRAVLLAVLALVASVILDALTGARPHDRPR